MPAVLQETIAHGWMGVDLFFILSGFLITGILLDSRASAHYFRDFYARRALRILPVYWACILVYAFAYPHTGAYFGLAFLFLANFAGAFGVSWPHGPGVFWSLAVEEHFYFLWPVTVKFLKRSWLLAFSILLVVGSPVLRGVCDWWGMDPEFQIHPYSFFRFDAMALGAILALWVRSEFYSRQHARQLALGLVGLSIAVTVVGWPFGVMQTKSIASSALRYTQAEMVFAALLVLALAYRATPYTALLRTRFARVTADLSYCIYLTHLALFDFYYRLLASWHVNDVSRFGPVGALALRCVVITAATYAVAAVSKRWLENPFLTLKRYFGPAPSPGAPVESVKSPRTGGPVESDALLGGNDVPRVRW
jgi:peptidoglycan/LPS O-acetylase OafA/YrhL